MEINSSAANDTALAQSQKVLVSQETLERLLELLELAARRGAFEIEEYRSIGEVYSSGRSCLLVRRAWEAQQA